MPRLPYSRGTDHADLHRDSGAQLLLELGSFLLALSGSWRVAKALNLSDEEVAGRLERFDDRLKAFFKANPKAALRKYILSATGRGIDLRACRVVAVLAALHVLESQDCVDIFRLAGWCVPTGDHADVLEARRVVAASGAASPRLVEVASVPGLWHPQVRLAPGLMQELIGGRDCIPVVSNGSLAAVRAARERRAGGGGATPSRKGSGASGDAAAFVAALPDLRPRELSDLLELRAGFVNQEAARRRVCLAAYRHLRRLRMLHVEGVDPAAVPAKQNLVLKGPTGSGKTLMIEALCRILTVPSVVVDLTAYSETGYIGEDLTTVPTRLLMAADGNVAVAQCGLIGLDEADKVAECGTGSRPMVSRSGVQRGLLRLLDGGEMIVPETLGEHPIRVRRVRFDTSNVLFAAMGAFSGWNRVAGMAKPIGFGQADGGDPARQGTGAATAAQYERYGLMPELMARLPLVVELGALSRAEMREILELNVVSRHAREMEAEGVGLEVDTGVVDLLVEDAMARGYGARGVQAAFTEALSEGCYQAYSVRGRGRVLRLHVEKGELAWEVTRVRSRRGRASEAGQIELPEGLESLDTGTDA